ncbi:MAG TPA: hypothetical protein VEZ41_05710 [Allosphingosinicella sp.]|nr:hypothetical protein [Allosphingosinicella sp.]
MRPRLRDQKGREVHLPCPTISEALRRRALFWVNRLSYGDVAHLLAEMAGLPVLSEDGVWRLVQREAEVLDAAQSQAIQASALLPEPEYVASEELYAPGSGEFVVMSDGIGVKAQKPTREKAGEPKKAKVEKRHDTDVLILPRRDGGEQVLCEGVSDCWTLVEAARSFLKQEWSGAVLPVVALTDGAKTIRADLAALFGQGVRVVLDWYHLEKRVYQQLSMAAHSMQQRQEWEGQVLAFLWRGKATEAQAFLGGLAPRNSKALAELVGYLDKHAEEIIDYERRQRAGRPIGSGRMEKCVDQVIGHRQKGKGMSWTKAGSRALALLKVAELNAQAACA